MTVSLVLDCVDTRAHIIGFLNVEERSIALSAVCKKWRSEREECERQLAERIRPLILDTFRPYLNTIFDFLNPKAVARAPVRQFSAKELKKLRSGLREVGDRAFSLLNKQPLILGYDEVRRRSFFLLLLSGHSSGQDLAKLTFFPSPTCQRWNLHHWGKNPDTLQIVTWSATVFDHPRLTSYFLEAFLSS